MDISSRIPLIDETARNQDSAIAQAITAGFRGRFFNHTLKSEMFLVLQKKKMVKTRKKNSCECDSISFPTIKFGVCGKVVIVEELFFGKHSYSPRLILIQCLAELMVKTSYRSQIVEGLSVSVSLPLFPPQQLSIEFRGWGRVLRKHRTLSIFLLILSWLLPLFLVDTDRDSHWEENTAILLLC